MLVGDESALVFGVSRLSYLSEVGKYRVRAQVAVRSKMTDKCTNCGRTESQMIADAKTLGLLQEFQCGVYTCCQIAEWADEQWLAWFEATEEDNKLVDDVTSRPDYEETQLVFVPVRLRRQQVPWYRNPENLR